MEQEQTTLSVGMKFRLEKFDNVTGECVEIIEGTDSSPPVVVYSKEQENRNDNSR